MLDEGRVRLDETRQRLDEDGLRQTVAEVMLDEAVVRLD